MHLANFYQATCNALSCFHYTERAHLKAAPVSMVMARCVELPSLISDMEACYAGTRLNDKESCYKIQIHNFLLSEHVCTQRGRYIIKYIEQEVDAFYSRDNFTI